MVNGLNPHLPLICARRRHGRRTRRSASREDLQRTEGSAATGNVLPIKWYARRAKQRMLDNGMTTWVFAPARGWATLPDGYAPRPNCRSPTRGWLAKSPHPLSMNLNQQAMPEHWGEGVARRAPIFQVTLGGKHEGFRRSNQTGRTPPPRGARRMINAFARG